MEIRLNYDDFIEKKEKIAIIGLGYVGLPLAVHLARHFSVTGYDIKKERLLELSQGIDTTGELSSSDLKEVSITYTNDPQALRECRLLIVTVPTPVTAAKIPDLNALISATTMVGKMMQTGSCVVYESTVYPGVTEEICVPILEQESNLRLGAGFTVGYSPERINPGDKKHTLENVTKIVSASDPHTRHFLTQIYGTVVKAGVFEASSIRVAEAAKVIENVQRDLNIALMNELAIIFHRLGLDTLEVLAAAGTKWNFLPFRPGLVGGHCIGVDPYYLTYKAEMVGYHPEVILAGRRINDNMGKYVAERTVKMLISEGKPVRDARILILGFTFKENITDIRNTRVIDIVKELEGYGIKVFVHDPLADPREINKTYGIKTVVLSEVKDLDGIVVAVAHEFYKTIKPTEMARWGRDAHPVIVDVKGILDPKEVQDLGLPYWRL
ncbi:MAG: nucleotide sugar dehydrogenase [Syntrophales bacterium]|nr:nucleotide sugar dehydrogenase [Syntrophales bacterium]